MEKDKTLVSVIIPTYNSSSTIEQCIQSCLDQDHENLEIIVVNDGSTDNTLEVINSLKEDRLHVINQLNRGCSDAKNTGLKNANGSYIQYLDADDYLSKDKISSQLIKIKGKPKSIAVCKTIAVFDNDVLEEIDTNLISRGGDGLTFLLRLLGSEGQRGMVQPNAYLISHALAKSIGEWDTTISPNPDEDGEYFARALILAEEVVFTDGVNFYRKSLSNSLSKIVSLERVQNQLRSIEKTFSLILQKGDSTITRELFSEVVSSHLYQHSRYRKELAPMARELLRTHGIHSFKPSGTERFKVISQLIGFENALCFRDLFKN